MKLFRASGAAWVIAGAVLSAPNRVGAQTPTCNLPAVTPCGSVTKCSPPCGPGVSVYHASYSPCTTATQKGSYDFTKTQYANTCYSGTGGCPVDIPPFRFWGYDKWSTSNNGCDESVASNDFANGMPDGFGGTTPGFWIGYQANWNNPLGDGCISTTGGEQRTVLEVTFPDKAAENTLGHKGWYAISAVPGVAGAFDFDAITGSAGCTPSTVPVINVDGVNITGVTCGSATATGFPDNKVSTPSNFFDVPVTLVTPSPDYYTEAGKSPASKSLIAGYQIMYSGGTTMDATSEPKFSDVTNGGWKPALDPADPTKALGFIPYGTAVATTVTIPKATCTVTTPVVCDWYWLAARLVYSDASENPSASFPVASSGPLLTSAVSGHCGPVRGGGSVAVTWAAPPAAERTPDGVRVTWQTTMEDDTASFRLVRSTIAPSGAESTPETLPVAVDAAGPYHPYELLDGSVDQDLTTSYAYYVQEITTSGSLGSLSPRVVVPAAAAPTGGSGGRNRGNPSATSR